MQNQENNLPEENVDEGNGTSESDIKAETNINTDEKTGNNTLLGLEQKISEVNEKYLRLYSEFDNYRKRTLKEKSEIIKTAAEEVFKSILPVMDDFERALKANETVEDAKTIKEGMQLIFNKLKNNSIQKGLNSFDSLGEIFNPDIMEAITHLPAEDENQKGKVVDEIEKGYKLGDKVIRFARVVVAQ